jgi:hypothetical protein
MEQKHFMETGINLKQPIMRREKYSTYTPEQFFNKSGREIAYVETPERFEQLQEGKDYSVLTENRQVQSSQNWKDCLVFVNPVIGETTLDVQTPHWRSITFEDVNATVKLNNGSSAQYYAANTKGVGFLKKTDGGIGDGIESFKTWTPKKGDLPDEELHHKILGLAPKGEFITPYGSMVDNTLAYTEDGMRTELHWGTVELKTIYYQGEPQSIAALRKQGVIPKDPTFIPCMGVRLFRTNTRVQELTEEGSYKTDMLWMHTIDVFNRETTDSSLDIPLITPDGKNISILLRVWAERIIKNLSVLATLEMRHSFLHSANITLAAEFADVQTTTPLEHISYPYNEKIDGLPVAMIKDMRDALFVIKILVQSAKKKYRLPSQFEEELAKHLIHEYMAACSNSDTSIVQAASTWMERMVHGMFIQKKKLSPPVSFKYGNNLKQIIQSWQI